jgi:hypothetical protein
MRLTELAARTRRFVGLIMMVVALPALGAGLLEWRRGSDVRILAVIYSMAGVYLAYEGLRLVRGR